jgi:glycerol-3-phosphate acyltransferase PlsY
MTWWVIVLVCLFGYFWGNISFAKILSRFYLKKDVTKMGSGNPGTVNMYRNFGFKVGIIMLVLDVSKGVLPAVVGLVTLGQEGVFIVGTAAVLGHCFPVIYKFKGGKGIATAIGVYWVSSPIAMTIAFIAALCLLVFFELAGAINILMIAGMTCWEANKYASHPSSYIIVGCILAIFVLCWFAHRKNILKTLTGDEKKTSFRRLFKRKKAPPLETPPAA